MFRDVFTCPKRILPGVSIYNRLIFKENQILTLLKSLDVYAVTVVLSSPFKTISPANYSLKGDLTCTVATADMRLKYIHFPIATEEALFSNTGARLAVKTSVKCEP